MQISFGLGDNPLCIGDVGRHNDTHYRMATLFNECNTSTINYSPEASVHHNPVSELRAVHRPAPQLFLRRQVSPTESEQISAPISCTTQTTRRGSVIEMFGEERSLEWVGKVQRRIGNHARF